jgi:hypothetical protein
MKLNATNPEIPWAKPAISDLLAVRKLRTAAEARLLLKDIKSSSDATSTELDFDGFLRFLVSGDFAITI